MSALQKRLAISFCAFVTLSVLSVDVLLFPVDWIRTDPWWLWKPAGALTASVIFLASAVEWLRTK